MEEAKAHSCYSKGRVNLCARVPHLLVRYGDYHHHSELLENRHDWHVPDSHCPTILFTNLVQGSELEHCLLQDREEEVKSRIASVEKLLFVQMLDLSHNELHSTEGLEAMQLLSCLNLSHNRIRSFSALDSLRHLDVSHNLIGEHSVDTTRHLCSSPLSNCYWTRDEVGRQVPSLVIKYWDAYIVLRDLNLKQLDIAGNVIAGDEFRSFVPQVVPKLVWLNGQKFRS